MKNLTRLIEKSRNMPALAPIYALEIDRQLRGMGKAAITFSAHALAESSIATARTLGIDQFITAQAKPKGGNAIYQAEMLVKEGMRSEAIAHAFVHAQGPEVNGLNLFYANHATQRPEMRLPYLNKYLEAYGLRIELEEGEKADFFYRLKSGKSFEKVDGPLVTVIMPAHNAESTIDLAVNSLLNQSWHNLQIIIVDDATTDGTLQKAKELAKRDPRVEVLSNQVSVGPYVCRNLGVMHTLGKWVTVHDADDWAFPGRIEQQVKALTDNKSDTCTGGMLRMNAHGQITRPTQSGGNFDGYQRLCYVSLMVQTEVFRKELGAWDSVRVSGDSELIERLKALGIKRTHIRRPLMLCLDNPTGLTNHPELFLYHEDGSVNKVRSDYKKAFRKWHLSKECKKLSPCGDDRFFDIPIDIQVKQSDIEIVISRKDTVSVVESIIDPDMTDPATILLNANEIAKTGNHVRAIALAEKYLPANLRYTVNVLKANAAIAAGNESDWLNYINAYLKKFRLEPIELRGNGCLFDRFRCAPVRSITAGSLVSVIMPAWNAQKTIGYSIRSILEQSWFNLELIIVDDASEDRTWEIIQQFAAKDQRIRAFRNSDNVGPYVCKNIAASQSKGDWITGHDADDWAHPKRIERQVIYCEKKKKSACMSATFRMSASGEFVKLNRFGRFVIDGVCRSALISLMIRAQYFHDLLGFWDPVRISGDSEILRRIEHLSGGLVPTVPVPTMIVLDNPTGLTNDSELGIGKSSIRSVYKKNYSLAHSVLDKFNTRLIFPTDTRGFRAPIEMLNPPGKVVGVVNQYKTKGINVMCNAKVDIAIITTLCWSGGNASSTLDEINYFHKLGLRYVVIHCPIDKNLGRSLSQRFSPYSEKIINWSKIKKITANVLICRHPAVISSHAFREIAPCISANDVFVVVNNSYLRSTGRMVYDRGRMIASARMLNANNLTFCPISPGIRSELLDYVKGDGDKPVLSDTDWTPTFDLSLYHNSPKLKMVPPYRIGRHGRDGAEKWHEDKISLRQLYPESNEFHISILGGANQAEKTLGELPHNWSVCEFGAIDPKDYLRNLDVFIYFPHSQLLEGFGRTIVEAMLSGVPVILPAKFEETFLDLPLYAAPHQVADLVRLLAQDDASRVLYLTEVQRIADERYSSSVIARRLSRTGLVGLPKVELDVSLSLTDASRAYRKSLLERYGVIK